MTGNRRWFIYESDAGDRYLVDLDEDIGDSNGFDRFGFDSPNLPMLPKGFQMRAINAKSQIDSRRRVVPVGKADHPRYNGTSRDFQMLGNFWNITSIRGEKVRRATVEA
jgi:hypothetical protein